MTKKSKFLVQLIYDEKYDIGRKIEHSENNIEYLYSLSPDSVIGDVLYDYLSENYPESLEKIEDHTFSLNRKVGEAISRNEIELVGVSEEHAESVKRFCKEFFQRLGLPSEIEIEVQYFNSLRDVEMQNLDKAVAKF